MSKTQPGINQNIVRRIVSGCRVAFDPRRTHEVERDMANRKRLMAATQRIDRERAGRLNNE